MGGSFCSIEIAGDNSLIWSMFDFFYQKKRKSKKLALLSLCIKRHQMIETTYMSLKDR